jgi:hypothetical protein
MHSSFFYQGTITHGYILIPPKPLASFEIRTEIEASRAINFVEEQSYSAKEETTAFEKWDQFWEYFERFWMQDEFFKVWSHPQWCFSFCYGN